MKKVINISNFVTKVTVSDPDTNAPVDITVMKHESGGMFAIDSSYLEDCFLDDIDPIIDDPFNSGQLVKFMGL